MPTDCTIEEMQVSVDYSLSLPQMIRLGEFDEVRTLDLNFRVIARDPPSSGMKQVDHSLVMAHFTQPVGIKEILGKLLKLQLRPADITDLLAFAGRFPERQRNFPIASLSSTRFHPNGFNTAPVIYADDLEKSRAMGFTQKRVFGLFSFSGAWGRDFRYLAFRDESVTEEDYVSRYAGLWGCWSLS